MLCLVFQLDAKEQLVEECRRDSEAQLKYQQELLSKVFICQNLLQHKLYSKSIRDSNKNMMHVLDHLVAIMYDDQNRFSPVLIAQVNSEKITIELVK